MTHKNSKKNKTSFAAAVS